MKRCMQCGTVFGLHPNGYCTPCNQQPDFPAGQELEPSARYPGCGFSAVRDEPEFSPLWGGWDHCEKESES